MPKKGLVYGLLAECEMPVSACNGLAGDTWHNLLLLVSGEEVADATLDDSGYVPQHAFIQETQQLSIQAAKNLQDLERLVKRG